MYQCNCGRSFEKNGSLRTHARFCKHYKKINIISKYKIENAYICECGKSFDKHQSLNAHFSQCVIHRNGKPGIDKFGESRKWNKGLTKKNNTSIANQASKLIGRPSSSKGRKHTIEARKKMSISAINRLQNDESHCKWFSVFNGKDFVKVQGTWERRVAERLTLLNEFWIREKIPYGKTKHYLPDFFLPDRNLYIEVKGWWKNRDLNKMNQVLNENEIDLRTLDSLLEIESFENGTLSIIDLKKFENTPT